MLNKFKGNNACTILAGVSAAAIAVVGIGGYFLHRKIVKRRLREQARQLAVDFVSLDDRSNDFLGGYDGYDDFEDFNTEGDYEWQR